MCLCVCIHINSCFFLNANEAKFKEYFQWNISVLINPSIKMDYTTVFLSKINWNLISGLREFLNRTVCCWFRCIYICSIFVQLFFSWRMRIKAAFFKICLSGLVAGGYELHVRHGLFWKSCSRSHMMQESDTHTRQAYISKGGCSGKTWINEDNMNAEPPHTYTHAHTFFCCHGPLSWQPSALY